MKSIRLFCAGLALAFIGSASAAQETPPAQSPPASVAPAPPPFPNFGPGPAARHHGTSSTRSHAATAHRTSGHKTRAAKHSAKASHRKTSAKKNKRLEKASAHKTKHGRVADKRHPSKRDRHAAKGHSKHEAAKRDKDKGRRSGVDRHHKVKDKKAAKLDRHVRAKDKKVAKLDRHANAKDKKTAKLDRHAKSKDKKTAKPSHKAEGREKDDQERAYAQSGSQQSEDEPPQVSRRPARTAAARARQETCQEERKARGEKDAAGKGREACGEKARKGQGHEAQDGALTKRALRRRARTSHKPGMRIAVVAPSLHAEARSRRAGRGDRLRGAATASSCIHPQCFLSDGHFAGPGRSAAGGPARSHGRPGGRRRLVRARRLRVEPHRRGRAGRPARRRRAARPTSATATPASCSPGFTRRGSRSRGGRCRRMCCATAARRRSTARSTGWCRRDPSALEPGLDGPAMAFNLTVLSNLLGTPLEPDFSGVDLLIEDVGEHLYRIDRTMFHVTASANIRQVAGCGSGGSATCFPTTPISAADEEAIVARLVRALGHRIRRPRRHRPRRRQSGRSVSRTDTTEFPSVEPLQSAPIALYP